MLRWATWRRPLRSLRHHPRSRTCAVLRGTWQVVGAASHLLPRSGATKALVAPTAPFGERRPLSSSSSMAEATSLRRGSIRAWGRTDGIRICEALPVYAAEEEQLKRNRAIV